MNLTPEQLRGLVEALRRQRQCDEDGTEIAVSRQAVDEAIGVVEAHASALERLAERDAEIARLKGHAEAMAEELENIEYGEGCKTRADKAYRADYPEK